MGTLGTWPMSSDLREPWKSLIFESPGRVGPDGQRMSWSNGDQRRVHWRPHLDMKLTPVGGCDLRILAANQIARIAL